MSVIKPSLHLSIFLQSVKIYSFVQSACDKNCKPLLIHKLLWVRTDWLCLFQEIRNVWKHRVDVHLLENTSTCFVFHFSLTIGLWPVWGMLTPLILFTLFMGFVVTIAMLPNFWQDKGVLDRSFTVIDNHFREIVTVAGKATRKIFCELQSTPKGTCCFLFGTDLLCKQDVKKSCLSCKKDLEVCWVYQPDGICRKKCAPS